jgi:hypothetical protein
MSVPLIGKFCDVVGLSYATPTQKDDTTSSCEFRYNESEDVSFSIGQLYLGRAPAKSIMGVADLVPAEDRTLSSAKLLNRARLLFSLTTGQGFERPAVIDEKVREIDSPEDMLIIFHVDIRDGQKILH